MAHPIRISYLLVGCVLALASGAALAQAQRPAQPPQPPQPAVQPNAPQAQFPQQPAPAAVQPPPAPAALLPPPKLLPTVALEPLLARVGRSANKKFIVSTRTPQEIYLGGAEANSADYPTLLAILRANALAAIPIGDFVHVMPSSEARFTSPLVASDNAALEDDEWVTRIITTENVEAAFFIPVLRPLLPQDAHFAAMPPRSIVIMDRYANVKRIAAIVRAIDRAP